MTEDEFMDKWNPTRQSKIIPCMLRVWEGKATVEQVWDEMDRFFTAVADGTADLKEVTDFDEDVEQIDVKQLEELGLLDSEIDFEKIRLKH